jgi:hypothetical protein
MKRILLVAASSSAIALASPAIASAHHHHGKRHHSRHNARVHVLDFRAAAAPASAPASPTTGPVTPTSNENAGTVTSFKEGVLTITLNNGNQVSGQVTERTDLQCVSATPSAGGEESDDQSSSGEGDHGASGEGQSDQTAHQDRVPAAHAAWNTGSEEGQQDADDETQSGSCTPATALVATTPVREAELSIGPSGAVWERVQVVH